MAHNNQKALVSMILGIVGAPFAFCCFPVGLVFGGVTLALGLIARREIETSAGAQSGSGFAVAGIVLGALEVLWFFLVVVLVILSVASGHYHGVTPGPGIPGQ